MLVEYNQPSQLHIGTIRLKPGVNRVDNDAWKEAISSGYKRSINGMTESGDLTIIDESRVNVALVKKTYDVKILEDWLADAKGPLKGAIKKQLSTMTDDEKEAV